MLVFEVKIAGGFHEKTVGEIHIQRLHDLSEMTKSGICRYQIRYPEGPWCHIVIKHKYSLGWFPLMEKVVKILKKEGFKTKHE